MKMKFKGFKTVALNTRNYIAKNSPTILTGMGVAGLIGTTISGIQATPKAMRIIDANGPSRQYHEGNFNAPELTKLDIVKLCWKEYIPTIMLGAVSIGCIVGANSINLKRNAALAGLYSVTNNKLEEYEAKVRELLGDKAHEKVVDDIAKDRVLNTPANDHEIFRTGTGETLCMDAWSGRYFMQDIEILRQSENKINKMLLQEPFASVNDFYYFIGLPDIAMGNEIGWTSDDGIINLRLSSQLTAKDRPCVVVDWDCMPSYM